jgi:hypothetical protein
MKLPVLVSVFSKDKKFCNCTPLSFRLACYLNGQNKHPKMPEKEASARELNPPSKSEVNQILKRYPVNTSYTTC